MPLTPLQRANFRFHLHGKNQVIDPDTGEPIVLPEPEPEPEPATLNFVIDGGGAVIGAGIAGWFQVAFDCTITASRLVADQSGSIVVDIWKDTYANLPATDADSITASAPPTLASAIKSEDSTLTGWTVALSAGDWLYFNVDSATTVEQVTISLTVER